MPRIHAHEHPVREIFSDKFAFSIPTYQRPYSWEGEQTSELFEDLLAASEGFVSGGGVSPEKITPYFLGSIVLIKEQQVPDGDVIDGQQRLTTLALLLSALRVSFEDQRQKSTFGSLLFEEGNQYTGTKDRCRLILRDRDHSFFEANILRHSDLTHLADELRRDLPDPQRRLAENTVFLRAKVAGLDVERRDAMAAFIL